MPEWLTVLITFISIAIFGFLAYKSAEVYFRDENLGKRYHDLEAYIKLMKKMIKKK